MRYTGPKNRIARREGLDLGMKTPGSKSHASLLRKINVPPGQHGLKGKRKVSEHARQLREKQKLRYIFGVTASQLKTYFGTASKKKGNTGILLSELLERRLDAVVYRLGFAPTMAAARQLIVHKHINVNDKMLSVPSYTVKLDDVITFAKESTKKIPYVEASLAQKDAVVAPWVEVKAGKGKLIAVPTSEIIEKQINLRLVVEFFSR